MMSSIRGYKDTLHEEVVDYFVAEVAMSGVGPR
jgi:hypothetical protein